MRLLQAIKRLFNEQPWAVTIPAILAIITFWYFMRDRFRPSCTSQITQLGLKWDSDDFSEATRNGNLPAIDAYLCGGMSPNAYYAGTDRYVLNLPAFQGTENFPEIVDLFKKHKVKFKQENRQHSGDWLFANSSPETLEDQLFVTLALGAHEDTSVIDAKKLIADGASPQRVVDTAETCVKNPRFPTNYMGKRHCQEMLSFFGKLGVKPRAS